MNKSTEQFAIQTILAKIVSFVLAFGFAGVFLHFLGSYWTYFDYGINAAANSFGLLFYSPVVLIVFLVTALVGNLSASRLKFNNWVTVLLTFILLIAAFIAMFALEAWRMRDYPNPNDDTIFSFLINYLNNLF